MQEAESMSWSESRTNILGGNLGAQLLSNLSPHQSETNLEGNQCSVFLDCSDLLTVVFFHALYCHVSVNMALHEQAYDLFICIF
jgi:hypothetical protein